MQDLTGKMVSFSTVPTSFHSTGTGSVRSACTTHVFSPSVGAPACADVIHQKFRLVQILSLTLQFAICKTYLLGGSHFTARLLETSERRRCAFVNTTVATCYAQCPTCFQNRLAPLAVRTCNASHAWAIQIEAAKRIRKFTTSASAANCESQK